MNREDALSILVLSSYVLLVFFRNYLLHLSYYPAGSDIFYYIFKFNHIAQTRSYWYIWNEYSNGVCYLTLLNLLAMFNTSSNVNILFIKLFIISIYLLAGVSMYFYVMFKLNNRYCAVLASFLYLSNKWIIMKMASGHLWHILAYSLIPIFFYLADKLLYSRFNTRYVVLLSVFTSFMFLLRFDPVILVIPFILIYIFLVCLFYWSKDILKHYVKFLIEYILLTIVLSIYQIFPFLMIPTTQTSRVFSINVICRYFDLDYIYVISGNAFAINYIFSVGHTDWNTHPFLPLWLHISLLLVYPILSFTLLFLKNYFTKKIEYISILSFLTISLISLFLASGFKSPFGGIYRFMYLHIFFIKYIRVPNRFVMVSIFVFSLLPSIAIYIFDKKYNLSSTNKLFVFVLLLLPYLLVNVFIFTHGFLVWYPKSGELEPHYYIRSMNINSSCRFVTVPYIYERMYTPGGWTEHDLGKYSGMYNGLYYLYQPLDSVSNLVYFIKFTKYIVNKGHYTNLPKILGIYNVKYIILQGYPANFVDCVFDSRYGYYQHRFFEKQSGLKLIYVGKEENYTIRILNGIREILAAKINPPSHKILQAHFSPKIYRNEYCLPHIFIPRGTIVVVGGLNAFLKLASINSFSFRDWNLIFADHILKHLGRNELIKQIKRSDYVLFVDSTPTDLAMMLANSTWIKSKKLVSGKSFGWFEDSWPVIKGYFAYDNYVISSHLRGARVTYDVRIDKKFNYSVWVRVFISNQAGNLKVIMDNKTIGYINAHDKNTLGFKWVKAGEVKLDKGMHTLEIINLNGHNKINCISVIKKGLVKKLLKYTKILICNKDIYMFDVSMLSKLNLNSNVTKRNVFLFKDNRPLHRYILKFRHKYNVTYIKFRKISPVKWVVYINSTGPYTLVFSDTYHKMWRAYVSGDEYKSIPSYYFINSFRINESGNYKVVIEFIGQKIQNVCLIISGLAYLGCMGYLLYDWRWKSK